MTSSSRINGNERMLPGWSEALDEASEWSVLLSDDPDDEELHARFDQWVQQKAHHADAWAHVAHVTGLVAQSKGLAFLPNARPAAATDVRATHLRAWKGTRAFAAVAAVAVIAWLAGPSVVLQLQADHVTGTAEQRLVKLQDGSTIRLAPASAVTVTYTDRLRTVRLLAGEAFFEVAPNPAKPFRVAAKTATITVLGTGFDVRQGEDGTDVAVSHGKVQVVGAARDRSVKLTNGQWARIRTDGRLTEGELSPASVGSWTGDRLVAIDRPLSDVVSDVRRYYDGTIIVTGRRLAGASVTGSYDMTDPAAALFNMVAPHGGTVRRFTPWLIIVS